ncbi:MAG: hypothetical protein KatS3mg099_193 [Candidatus Parcubacteria bacterium]|nr:MAG: hypothetical protein KatS3mg099_193 [Candidatus Parcubacteria bacterium]
MTTTTDLELLTTLVVAEDTKQKRNRRNNRTVVLRWLKIPKKKAKEGKLLSSPLRKTVTTRRIATMRTKR